MDVFLVLPLPQIKNYTELLKFQKPIKFPLMRSTTLLYNSQALFIVVFFIKVYFDIISNLKLIVAYDFFFLSSKLVIICQHRSSSFPIIYINFLEEDTGGSNFCFLQKL